MRLILCDARKQLGPAGDQLAADITDTIPKETGMPTPRVIWEPSKPDLELPDGWEDTLTEFFAQSPQITQVTIRCLAPGRSGAYPFIAHPVTAPDGQPMRRYAEFVKISRLQPPLISATEAELFQRYVAGSNLVWGREAQRPALRNTADTIEVYSYQLFEAGDHLVPIWVMAMTDEAAARRALAEATRLLADWYGQPQREVGFDTGMSVARRAELLANLKKVDAPLTARLAPLLANALDGTRVGATSRVHYDLHSENVLVEPGHDRAYIVDFGNLRTAGSPCIDLARMECDLLYRLLPYDLVERQVAEVEAAIWQGNVDIVASHLGGRMVMTLRAGAASLLQSPNGALWWATGRILHTLRMLTGTWPNEIPYNLADRKRGLLACLGVLSDRLVDLLEGGAVSAISFAGGAAAEKPGATALRCAVWLVEQRRNDTAFALASKLARAGGRVPAEVGLLGEIGGIAARRSISEILALQHQGKDKKRKTALARGVANLSKGMLALREGRKLDRAKSALKAAETIFDEGRLPAFSAIALDQLARVCQRLGEVDQAKRHFQDSVTSKRRRKDRSGLGAGLSGLGDLHMASGEYEDAEANYEECLELARWAEDQATEAQSLTRLAQPQIERLVTGKPLEHLEAAHAILDGLPPDEPVVVISRAFAEVFRGFYFAAWQAIDDAAAYESAARNWFERVADTPTHWVGTALCEILSGEVCVLREHRTTARSRIEAGMRELRKVDRVACMDHGLRAVRFLERMGQPRAWLITHIKDALDDHLPASVARQLDNLSEE